MTLEKNAASFGWQELIETAEAALGTATQGAVKRADEREFARLNAANPMFCRGRRPPVGRGGPDGGGA